MAAIVLVLAMGVTICRRAAQLFGGHDPQVIVLDEIAALPIVYLGIGRKGVAIWLGGWVLFRIFDITKPPPVRQVERLPGGWGIMADDVVAAGYACLVLHGLVWIADLLGWSWQSATA